MDLSSIGLKRSEQLPHCEKEDTNMKTRLGVLMILALVAGMATNTTAKPERKEVPKARFVEETLEAVGGVHNPEKIRIKKISSIEIGETFYHVFQGKLDTVGYHIIIFDNQQNYLGFYKSDYPPTNYEIKTCIVLDSGAVDDSGNTKYYKIPISADKGLPPMIVLNVTPVKLEKPPEKEGAEEGGSEGGAEAGSEGESEGGKDADDAEGGSKDAVETKAVPEYREWTITHRGKPLTVRALYVKQTFAKVTLKAEASGRVNDFDITALSKADRAYIRQFK
jgi:hypothetical protein